MKLPVRLISVVLASLTLWFVLFSTASARSFTSEHYPIKSTSQHGSTASYQRINIVNYQLAVQRVLKQTKTTNPQSVQPSVNYKCRFLNYNGNAGTLCVVVYLACVFTFCTPYAVDLNFNQALLDSVAAAGGAGVGLIISVVSGIDPSLASFAGIIGAGLAGSLTALDLYGKIVCGGNGAGIYIGFPSGVDLHC